MPTLSQDQLKDFAISFARSPCDVDVAGRAAKELLETVGEDAYGEALGVVAFFAFMSRVVDVTGHTHPMLTAIGWCQKRWRLLLVGGLALAFAFVAAAIHARRGEEATATLNP